MINFSNEEYGDTTNDINEAIFIDSYGHLLSGEFDMGMRGIDHNVIIPYYNDTRSHAEKWKDVHVNGGIVRLVPETMVALIDTDQILNDTQKAMLENSSYEVERY